MKKAMRRQRGYALLMVMAALTVTAFVAIRFAERMNELRRGAIGLGEYAEARAKVASAKAVALYFSATRPLQPAGRGEPHFQLRADGRPYRMPDGALVAVQDARGLLSVNAGERNVLLALLVADGLDLVRAQAWMDVLDDYLDTDTFKRLNGAEAAEYRERGLAPPRNDWMVSVRELERLPLWRDDPARLARLQALFTTNLGGPLNPLTAPVPVLDAVLSGAPAAQRELLMTLRQGELLTDGVTASKLTGLRLDGDEFIFAAGYEMRLAVWSPGLPRSLEYNARLTPAGQFGPWILLEQQSAPRLSPLNAPIATPPFPLPWDAGEQSRQLAPVAP